LPVFTYAAPRFIASGITAVDPESRREHLDRLVVPTGAERDVAEAEVRLLQLRVGCSHLSALRDLDEALEVLRRARVVLEQDVHLAAPEESAAVILRDREDLRVLGHGVGVPLRGDVARRERDPGGDVVRVLADLFLGRRDGALGHAGAGVRAAVDEVDDPDEGTMITRATIARRSGG
jgi:hypothetical protein